MSVRALRRGTMAGRGAVAAFAPENIVGAVEVWVADDVALADAAAVTTWTGRKAALALTQATSGKRPVYDLDGVGGQPSVNFDGDDDLLVYAASDALSTALSGHFFIVCHTPSFASSDFASSYDQTGSGNGVAFNQFSSSLRMLQYNSDTQDRVVAPASALTAGNNYLLEYASSGTAYELRINNTVQTKTVTNGDDSGDWFGDTTNRDNFTVGGRKDSGEFAPCPVRAAAVIVVDGAISGGDRTALNTWVSTKYGITLA